MFPLNPLVLPNELQEVLIQKQTFQRFLKSLDGQGAGTPLRVKIDYDGKHQLLVLKVPAAKVKLLIDRVDRVKPRTRSTQTGWTAQARRSGACKSKSYLIR